jgi:hypothetical protein
VAVSPMVHLLIDNGSIFAAIRPVRYPQTGGICCSELAAREPGAGTGGAGSRPAGEASPFWWTQPAAVDRPWLRPGTSRQGLPWSDLDWLGLA